MIASVSDIRTATWLRARRRAPSPAPGQRGTLVCLNSLRSVHSSRSSARSTSSALAAVHEPDERGALAHDEGRDAEHVPAVVGLGVLLGERPSAGGPTRPRPRPRRRRGRPTSRPRRARRPWRSGGLGRGGRRTRRRASRGSGRRTSRGPRCPRAARARRCPTRRARAPTPAASPSSTCTWSSENGRKRTSQSRPSRRPGDDGLVAVAGEGAAVVEADGELAGHGTSSEDSAATVVWQPRRRPHHSCTGAQCEPGQRRRSTNRRSTRRRARGRTRRRRRRRRRGAAARRRGSRRPRRRARTSPARRRAGVAAENAAVAWPDGNELVIGRCRPWWKSMSA